MDIKDRSGRKSSSASNTSIIAVVVAGVGVVLVLFVLVIAAVVLVRPRSLKRPDQGMSIYLPAGITKSFNQNKLNSHLHMKHTLCFSLIQVY